MRPGERLHEVLLSDNESFIETSATGLRGVATRRPPARLDGLDDSVDELRELVASGRRDDLKQRCLELAEWLQ